MGANGLSIGVVGATGQVGQVMRRLLDERDFLEIPEMPVLGTGKVDLKRAREIAQERHV